MSTAKELCEKVLANGIISRSGKANAENAHAAPRLAKMLLKAIEQRDECVTWVPPRTKVADGSHIAAFDAELDRIAAGEGE